MIDKADITRMEETLQSSVTATARLQPGGHNLSNNKARLLSTLFPCNKGIRLRMGNFFVTKVVRQVYEGNGSAETYPQDLL